MIRPIQKEDIPAVLDIYNWYILHTNITFETEELTLEAFTQRVEAITSRYPWIVMEEDGVIKGYAYLGTFNPRAAYDWTADLSIYLDHEERGHGLGTLLMDAILQEAQQEGYYQIVSIVTSGNTASEHLHEKCGFVRKGRLENTGYKNGKWLGITYYMKTLRAAEGAPCAIQYKKEREGK
ncbi:MAG: N-acetyltransferase family protein [Lactimicrobium sp.]|jgi:L-amino acid N-acyltransferase YncA|uniref:GNAT family N-acetyltransferase n=1 Tax=Lactimicrobium sp. TaxID=2563780 RepID=UPI002F35A041